MTRPERFRRPCRMPVADDIVRDKACRTWRVLDVITDMGNVTKLLTVPWKPGTNEQQARVIDLHDIVCVMPRTPT